MEEILEQVNSPFTDEEIEKLIKKYIECNCDIDELYRNVNCLNEEKIENPYLNNLYHNLFSVQNMGKRLVSSNENWHIIGSNQEYLSVPNNIEDQVPIYRIYINAKGEDKAKIIEEYIKECENRGIDYRLKYAKKDGRDDEILILSYGEELKNNIKLIEKITEGMNLGDTAELAGRYKEKFGIAEEYLQANGISYTESRLYMIPIAMQKYLLEHLSEFEDYLDEENMLMANYRLDKFNEESQDLLDEIEEIPENEKIERENLIRQQVAYQNNINPDNIKDEAHLFAFPQPISKSMQLYMAKYSKIAIPEIIQNYRIACKIFGISRSGFFSTITEELMSKDRQTQLQKREEELRTLECEEIKISETETLIAKQTMNEGHDITE